MTTTTPRNAEDLAQGQVRDGSKEDEEKRHQGTSTVVDGPDQALDRFLASVGSSPRHQQRELARDGFTVWLIAQQHRDDWVGHLAKEVAYDTTWPRHATRLRELHDYLYDLHGVMAESHAALDQAWAEWREVAR